MCLSVYRDRAPLLCVTGSAPAVLTRLGALLAECRYEVDSIEATLCRGVTTWVVGVREAEAIPLPSHETNRYRKRIPAHTSVGKCAQRSP